MSDQNNNDIDFTNGIFMPASEMERALKLFGKNISEALDYNFGAGKSGFILIVVNNTKDKATLNWISDLSRATVLGTLEKLTDRVKNKEEAALTLKKEYFGG